MAFIYAYSLGAGSTLTVKDLPLDTAANFPVVQQKKGTLVNQTAGLLRRVGAAGGTAIGVMEGTEFVGLVAQGQPYAATNTSFTSEAIDTGKNPNGLGKVRLDKAAVYKVPVYTGGATDVATNAHIGNSYAINLDGNGDQQVDLNVTATPSVKVVDRTLDGTFVFVTLV